MSSIFNTEEVLEIAVQIEKNGAAFYRRAAEIVEDLDAKKLFEELAVMEDAHEMFYEKMRADPDILAMLIGEPEGEAVLYLRAFANGNVFPKNANPASEIDNTITVEEILRKAIGMELKSIAFYQAIKDATPADLGKNKVESIIGEERRHVVKLTEKLSSVR